MSNPNDNQKYSGRDLNALRKAPLSSYTGEEMEFFNKEISKPVKSEEPSFLGKIGLLGRAVITTAKEKVENVGEEISMKMIRQAVIEHEDKEITKACAIANLNILKAHGKITEEEHKIAMDKINS
jgi:hypothetical protein